MNPCRRFCFHAPLGLAMALACIFLAACSGTAASPGKVSAPVYQVDEATVAGLGHILVDGTGFTLYMYQPDAQGPSQCTSMVCVQAWPPLVLPAGVTSPLAGPGVEANLLGVTRRSGGVLQVTYDRWPLYRYFHDYRPGQVNGQADDMGAWYVLGVDGSVDRDPVSSSQ
jgi:predicted lipoprotein with Yx(FWY)xxD motif